MQEDKLRHDSHHHTDAVPSSEYRESDETDRRVLIPNNLAEKPVVKKAKEEFDMFAEDGDDDMFAEPTTSASRDDAQPSMASAVPAARAIDMSMLDDFDDEEGYYKIILGELLDNRYHVQSNLGKGMFSAVVRALDQVTSKPVAIKLIRSNETM